MERELGVVGTRVADFRVSPTRVAVGEAVTVAGTLQWHTPVLCLWYPLEGRAVEVVADTAKLGEVTTGAGGGFRFAWTPREVGAYWVKARFPGDWLYSPCESETVKVEVITREQKEAEERQFWALVGVGVATAVGIAGLVLYYMEKRGATTS